MTSLVLTVAVALLTLATDGTPKSDLDKYQGEWVLVSEEFEGKTVAAKDLVDDSKDLSYTVRGDKLLYTSRGEDRWATIHLDQTKSPKTYDLVRDDGRPLKGIYTWDAETIQICSADDGGDRPKEFKTKAGIKNRIRVWKRRP